MCADPTLGERGKFVANTVGLVLMFDTCYAFVIQQCFLCCRMSARVYIGRLSHRARDRDVEKLFKSFGRIREIVLKNGYGFVVSRFYIGILLLLAVPFHLILKVKLGTRLNGKKEVSKVDETRIC